MRILCRSPRALLRRGPFRKILPLCRPVRDKLLADCLMQSPSLTSRLTGRPMQLQESTAKERGEKRGLGVSCAPGGAGGLASLL